MRLALIGAPGSGKGTQGELVARELGVPHISSGEMLREMCAADERIRARYQDQIEAGVLIPDADMIAILAERLMRPDARKGYVLDGFPRDLAQALLFDATENGRNLDAAVDLEVSEADLMARLVGRLVCRVCGASYHAAFAPPAVKGRCDRDGSELVGRADDEPEAIRIRLQVYHERTEPLVAHYRDTGKLVTVDASGPPDQVFRCLMRLLFSGADQSSNG